MANNDTPINFPIALDTMHRQCHAAADAFWKYWAENGETHKHGYYESTWGAINRAIRLIGVKPHQYGGGVSVQDPIEPDIQWNHVDGPLLHTSDASLYWLRWRDRVALALGLLTVNELNALVVSKLRRQL